MRDREEITDHFIMLFFVVCLVFSVPGLVLLIALILK